MKSLNENKLRILSYLFGAIYFLSLAYFITSFSIFNLFIATPLAISSIFLIALFIYYQKIQDKKNNAIKLLIDDSEKFKHRYEECNQTFRSMFDHVTDGIALLNLQLDFFKTNKRFNDIFGYTSEKILTWNLDHIVPLSGLSKHQIEINRLLAGKSDYYPFKIKIIKKSGDAIWLSITIALIRDANNKPYYFVMYAHNFTAQKNTEDYLSYLSLNDTMLNIPNRHQFDKFVDELTKSQNHQKKFGVFLIDLDNFKNINHTMGFQVGNKILKVLAERLKSFIHQQDLLARLGSDEFIVVLTDKIQTEYVQNFATKLLSEIAKPIQIRMKKIYVTASVGISIYPDHGFTTRKLLKHADIALHYIKEHNKNNYQFYSDEMVYKEKTKLKTRNVLSRALLSDGFAIKFQPRFNADYGHATCLQAMLDLPDSDNLIGLRDMISLVNDINFVTLICEWLVDHAIKQLHIWHQSGVYPALAISCNYIFIRRKSNVEKILKLLNEYRISTRYLQLEVLGKNISFNDIEADDEFVYSLLTLKQAGITLIASQFEIIGSLFSQSRKQYFDKIKLDNILIQQISDPSTSNMLKAIILKSTTLGMKTIAEQIINEEQKIFLTQSGCSELQGPYLAKLLSVDEAKEFITKQKFEVVLNEPVI